MPGKGMDPSRLRLVADPPDRFGAAAAAAKAVVLDVTSNAAVDPAIVHTGCDIRVEEAAPGDEGSTAKEQKPAGGGATSVGAAGAAPVAEGVAAAKAGPNVAARAKKVWSCCGIG